MRKTQDVKDFVEGILRRLPDPLVEDVTDQVFLVIEKDPALFEEYGRLCDEHGRRVVHKSRATVDSKGAEHATQTRERLGEEQIDS